MKDKSPPCPGALTLLFGLLLTACGGGGGHEPGNFQGHGPDPEVNPGLPEYVTVAPESLGDGWSTSSPAQEGIDPDALLRTLEDIRDGDFPGIDSLVIARHGRLVAEGYFNGYGRETVHDLRSTGKSITSALAGIAIEQGILGLHDPIAQHIPAFENHANVDARKRAIEVFHLLNMNSGLACNDWLPASPGNEENMYNARDWVAFILDLPMVANPGSLATYCTGGVVVLGHIVSLRSGMTLDAYAASYLFAPLGIQQSAWRRSPDGRATGGGGLRLTPRDAAKFGALYLADGTWNGARILSSSWVQQSREHVHELGDFDYGYLWWKRSFAQGATGNSVESFYTAGNGGNFVFVFPSLDLVIVFTGSNYNSSLMDQPYSIVAGRLLPAVH